MLTNECDDGIQLRTLRHQQQPPRRHFGSHEFTETEMLMNNTTAISVVDRRCVRDSLVVGNAIIINEYDQDEEDYRQHLQLPPPPQIDEQSDVDDDELVAVNGQAGSFGSAAAAAIALSASRLIPNKSQVLLYFQSATCFKLRHTGGELQVTDSADFPLFDVWIEMDCCRCTWVLESYGKTVLLMNENSSASSVSSKHQSAIVITDWNGDLFGHLISGDPFIVQNAEKTTIAKLIVDESRVAPLTEERGLSSSSTNVDGTWISVLESSGNGRPIAKIDANDVIVYGADVGFQLKLLTLAAIVRCTATWSMPGRRRIGGSANFCCASISSLLNCCAYCFY